MKIIVIGAGPAGCFAGEMLAKLGHDVRIFEEHSVIGAPVQCTGLVTSGIHDIIDIPRKIIVNKIRKVNIIYNERLKIKFFNPNLVLDRKAFDQYLAGRAKKAGAKFYLGHKFTGLSEEGGQKICEFRAKKQVYYFADVLIGADGPSSTVRKKEGFSKPECWTGIQVVVNHKNSNEILFFPDHNYFSWIVPENKGRVRVGVVARRNTRHHFYQFLAKHRFKIRHRQAGVIPEFRFFQRTSRNNTYILGDAAGFVKATTGGGIIPSLLAAKELAKCIHKGRNYEFAWRKKIGVDLLAHKIIRRAMDRVNYNYLIRDLNKKKLKRILGEVDRETPIKLCWNLIKNDPLLLKYVRHII